MIEFENGLISLSRDGRRNLEVSLRLLPGELAVIIGHNGSGKTTILDTVAGFAHLDSGRLTIEPYDLPIAYAVQDSASGLLPWRTILANILLPARLRNAEANPNMDEVSEKALDCLARFGLAERKNDYPYKLSEGEKQLVNLVRAASTPSSVVLLDEPFASLNARARSRAKMMLLDFVLRKTTILVTHDAADLDWPIKRFFRVIDSIVTEISVSDAKGFLQNATEASV
jgi:ABC-type nitrate/sulfonate/bicarbonate transport system ATPase subunit